MPEIQPIRGLRYDLGHVGSLSDVVAPPYDVIDKKYQEQLYKRHPANVIRLILNRTEPGDDDQENRYSRAARFLKNWQSEGVLTKETDPAIYVYHQEFEVDQVTYLRKGFMAGVKLTPFGEGNIYPHEETHSAAKADRLKLLEATQANLSQIFGLYPDSENQVQTILEDHVVDKTPLVAVDDLKVTHKLWPVTDIEVLNQVMQTISEFPMYVADGHHRFETACNYQQLLNQQNQVGMGDPANYVLTMLVSMSDQGMIVLPTHRLFKGLPSFTSSELKMILADKFEVQIQGKGSNFANHIWEEIETADNQGTIGLYCKADNTWLTATIIRSDNKQ